MPGMDIDLVALFSQVPAHARVSLLKQIIETSLDDPGISALLLGLDSISRHNFVSTLPLELVHSIFEHMDTQTLARCLLVEKQWLSRVMGHERLWMSIWNNEQDSDTDPSPDFPSQTQSSILSKHPSYRFLAEINRLRRLNAMWIDGDPHTKTISCHDGVVTCLRLVPPNKVISASDDGSLKLWCTLSGKLLISFVGHHGGVWTMDVWKSYLVSGSTDRTLRLWNIHTGKLLGIFRGHTSTVRCVLIYGDDSETRLPTIISGSRDHTLRIWNVKNRTTSHVLAGHSSSVRCMAIHGEMMASGSYDGTARIWNIETGMCFRTFFGHSGKIYSVVFANQGRMLVTGGIDTNIYCWDIETGECMAILEGHRGIVGHLSLFKDLLVSGNTDGSIRIWSLDPHIIQKTDGCLQRFRSDENIPVRCFQITNTKLLIGTDRSCKLWDPNTGTCLRTLVSGTDMVWKLVFDSSTCVVAHQMEGRAVMTILSFVAESEQR